MVHTHSLVEICSDWSQCRTPWIDPRGTLWYGTMCKAEAMPLQRCNSWLRPSATCAGWELLRQWLRYAGNLCSTIKDIYSNIVLGMEGSYCEKLTNPGSILVTATIGDSLAQGDSFVWFFSQVFFLFAPDTGHLSRTIMPMDIGSFKCLFSCCWVTPLWPIASKFPILQERRCSFAVARSYCKDEPFVSFCPVQICPPVLFQEDNVFHCQ